MAARTGSSPKPSTQIPAEPPQPDDALAARIAQIPRRMTPIRRTPVRGEIWLQSDDSPDGWIRARVIEAGPGFLGLLAHTAPPIGQGTWARLAGPTDEPDQIRIFPVAVHSLGDAPAPVLIECEIPANPASIARFLRES